MVRENTQLCRIYWHYNMYVDKSMHRHSGVYRGHYRDVNGRLFVSYKSYLVLLKYMIG